MSLHRRWTPLTRCLRRRSRCEYWSRGRRSCGSHGPSSRRSRLRSFIAISHRAGGRTSLRIAGPGPIQFSQRRPRLFYKRWFRSGGNRAQANSPVFCGARRGQSLPGHRPGGKAITAQPWERLPFPAINAGSKCMLPCWLCGDTSLPAIAIAALSACVIPNAKWPAPTNSQPFSRRKLT